MLSSLENKNQKIMIGNFQANVKQILKKTISQRFFIEQNDLSHYPQFGLLSMYGLLINPYAASS